MCRRDNFAFSMIRFASSNMLNNFFFFACVWRYCKNDLKNPYVIKDIVAWPEKKKKVSLKGARGMGQVPGEGEGGRREDKKCKAKG